ncbi:MAG: PHP domain-containing protein [Pseudomonadota bacterium]
MTDSFVHLRLHSIYSLLEGAMQVKTLPKLCADGSMPAVAITDTNNLFGALEFAETAVKAGVQPLIGCQIALAYGPPPPPGQRMTPPAPLVLIAQSERGYRNLMALSSRAYLGAGNDPHHVTMEDLGALAADLICLTGGSDGPLGRLVREGRAEPAVQLLDHLSGLFGDRLYIELQRHGPKGGRALLQAL